MVLIIIAVLQGLCLCVAVVCALLAYKTSERVDDLTNKVVVRLDGIRNKTDETAYDVIDEMSRLRDTMTKATYEMADATRRIREENEKREGEEMDERAKAAERAFTEGVSSILNYDIKEAKRKQ